MNKIINQLTEEIKQRIGWLASECGTESFHIAKLESELVRRKARLDVMQKQIKRLYESLEKSEKVSEE